MKIQFTAATILSTLFLLTCPSNNAAAAMVFWSFQNTPAGTGAATSSVTSNNGFTGTPTLTQLTGGTIATTAGGAASYNYNGTDWLGSGGTTTPGFSMGWFADPNVTFANAGFSLSLNTTGQYDFGLRFDLRAAGAGVPTNFSSIEYSINGGSFVPTALNPTWSADGVFHAVTIDFASLNAIENQSAVTLRFNFAAGGNQSGSIRIDNLVVNAVPEPGIGALMLLGVGVVAAFRRRLR